MQHSLLSQCLTPMQRAAALQALATAREPGTALAQAQQRQEPQLEPLQRLQALSRRQAAAGQRQRKKRTAAVPPRRSLQTAALQRLRGPGTSQTEASKQERHQEDLLHLQTAARLLLLLVLLTLLKMRLAQARGAAILGGHAAPRAALAHRNWLPKLDPLVQPQTRALQTLAQMAAPQRCLLGLQVQQTAAQRLLQHRWRRQGAAQQR